MVIGGLGGSGTRVVAEILIQSGFYLGQDLNRENDNLLFTYLFKHPRLFSDSIHAVHPKHRALFSLHERLFCGRLPLFPGDAYRFAKAAWDTHRSPTYRWRFGLKRLNRLLRARRVEPGPHWGWKEPATIFHLHGLADFYPEAKYILVMRNGLDMCYSTNSQQHEHWGRSFEVDSQNLSPTERFKFWQRANSATIDTCRKLFDRFLVIRLEELCLEPHRTIRQLLEFAGLRSVQVEPHIAELPKLPSSQGRYLRHDTSWIDDDCRQTLDELGYGSLLEQGAEAES